MDIKPYLKYYVGCQCLSKISDGIEIQGILADPPVMGGTEWKIIDTEHVHPVTYFCFAPDIKPILRPISSIIAVDLIDILRRISLIGLTDCDFDCNINAEANYFYCNAEKNGRVIDAISYNGNIWQVMNNDGDMANLNPQADANHLLIEKGYWIFGDQYFYDGSIIDASTL